MAKKSSFIKLIQLWGIIIITAISGIIAALEIADLYQNFNSRSDEMRTNYIEHQKQMIKREVNRVVDMVQHEIAQSRAAAETTLKTRIYEAHSIAQNIYNQNKSTRSSREIQKMIRDALSPVRYQQGSGYFFIITLDGNAVLFPGKPEKEGLNILDITDAEGKYFIKDMIEKNMKSDEGFFEYPWVKTDSDKNEVVKISFLKKFKPYNWIIGTGLYTDDIEKKLKTELISTISHIRFKKEGYIFVNRLNGDALISNGKVYPGTKKLWEQFDENSQKIKEIFEKEYKASLKQDGDYIYYSWEKLTDMNVEAPKVSFIYGIPELQWLVGSGVYLDDIETDIALLQKKLNSKIKIKIYYSIIFVIVIAVFLLFLLNRLSRRFKNDFKLFLSVFGEAADSDKQIDRNLIQFDELDKLAKNANTMLKDKIIARQALADEKERLFVTIHSIGDAVITTDVSGKVTLMNKVAENLTGWKSEEAQGKPLTDVFVIINAITRSKVKNPVTKALETGEITKLANHTILISKNSTEYQIADSAAPIKNVKKETLGVVLVFRNVTEEYRMREELQRTQKLKSLGTLAGGIAHDFNNILTGLFGNIELAKLSLSPEDKSYKYIQTADQAFSRAADLTKQLLTFAKGGEPLLENINLKQLVKTTALFNLSGSNVKAEFSLPDNLWQIKADKGQIDQVIANLVINAKQSMPDGGRLFVKAENVNNFMKNSKDSLSGDFVRLSIRDEGIGIPEKHLIRIFDPYFTTRQTGNGLGLSIVHSIIEKHNGHINVESKPDNGTTFTIFIPAESSFKKGTSAMQTKEIEKSLNKSIHILVMDDEELVRNSSEAMLEASGYKVELAVDGKEAIEKYNSNPFDIVIMDLTIPGGTGGKEAVKKLIAINPDAKVIVSSGYSNDPVMANYSDYGFKGRLVKPYQIDDLKKEIRRVLETG